MNIPRVFGTVASFFLSLKVLLSHAEQNNRELVPSSFDDLVSQNVGNVLYDISHIAATEEECGNEGDGFSLAWANGEVNGIIAQQYDKNGEVTNSQNASSFHYAVVTPIIKSLYNGYPILVWGNYGEYDGWDIEQLSLLSNSTQNGTVSLVNPYTPGNQMHPSVAVLTDGSYVITWFSDSQNGIYWNIYARRFNENGTQHTSPFQVSPSSPTNQQLPSIAALNNGGFVIVWQSEAYGISGQLYQADNSPNGAVFGVSSSFPNYQKNPCVAASKKGPFVVVWQNNNYLNSNSEGIVGQQYNLNGTLNGNEFLINSLINGNHIIPYVSFLKNGNFIVVWQGKPTTSWEIYARSFDPNHEEEFGVFQVNDNANGDQVLPFVASLQDGGFLITWQVLTMNDSNLGYVARYTKTGIKRPLKDVVCYPLNSECNQEVYQLADTREQQILTNDQYKKLKKEADHCEELLTANYTKEHQNTQNFERLYHEADGENQNLKRGLFSEQQVLNAFSNSKNKFFYYLIVSGGSSALLFLYSAFQKKWTIDLDGNAYGIALEHPSVDLSEYQQIGSLSKYDHEINRMASIYWVIMLARVLLNNSSALAILMDEYGQIVLFEVFLFLAKKIPYSPVNYLLNCCFGRNRTVVPQNILYFLHVLFIISSVAGMQTLLPSKKSHSFEENLIGCSAFFVFSYLCGDSILNKISDKRDKLVLPWLFGRSGQTHTFIIINSSHGKKKYFVPNQHLSSLLSSLIGTLKLTTVTKNNNSSFISTAPYILSVEGESPNFELRICKPNNTESLSTEESYTRFSSTFRRSHLLKIELTSPSSGILFVYPEGRLELESQYKGSKIIFDWNKKELFLSSSDTPAQHAIVEVGTYDKRIMDESERAVSIELSPKRLVNPTVTQVINALCTSYTDALLEVDRTINPNALKFDKKIIISLTNKIGKKIPAEKLVKEKSFLTQGLSFFCCSKQRSSSKATVNNQVFLDLNETHSENNEQKKIDMSLCNLNTTETCAKF